MIIFICIGMIVFVTQTNHANEDNQSSEEIIFNMATLAPKGIGWAKNIKDIIQPELKRISNGQINLKWYWSGTLGDDNESIRHMQTGRIDGCALTGYGTLLACPDMAVLELPFMFNNYQEVDYIRETMYETFEKSFIKNGYKLIAFADQDFDQLYSTTYQMNTLDDFKKANILCWFGDMEKIVLEQFGSHPKMVSILDVGPNLRQGIADTFISPSMWIVGSQIYTIMKYVNPIKIRYSPAVTIITLKAWGQIPENLQKKLPELKQVIKNFRLKCRDENERSFKAMLKYGLIETQMDNATLIEMKKRAKKLWFELADKMYSRKLLEDVLFHLKEFRAKQKVN